MHWSWASLPFKSKIKIFFKKKFFTLLQGLIWSCCFIGEKIWTKRWEGNVGKGKGNCTFFSNLIPLFYTSIPNKSIFASAQAMSARKTGAKIGLPTGNPLKCWMRNHQTDRFFRVTDRHLYSSTFGKYIAIKNVGKFNAQTHLAFTTYISTQIKMDMKNP